MLAGLVAFGALALAADAEAAQRYAAPGGVTAGSCPQAEPCRIDHAVNDAEEGDQVIVLSGDYDVSGLPPLATTKTLTVHGSDPMDKPRIVSSNSEPTLLLGDGSSSYNLDLTAQSGKAALELGADVNVSGVIARSNGTTAVHIANGQIRDTAAFAAGSDGGAIYLEGNGGNSTISNVTAISDKPESSGIFLRTYGTSSVEMRNTIARGLRGDLGLEGYAPGGMSLNVDYSNIRVDTTLEFGGSTTLTAGPHNQDGNTVVPLFADLAGYDVHQLAGSPTIDAGLADPSIGTDDFDGEARVQGAAPDIGADEYPPPVPGSSPAPISTPVSGGGKRRRGALYVAGAAPVRRGKALLHVHCVGRGSCGGAIRLIYRRVSKRHAHGKTRRVHIQYSLGRKPFQIEAGKRGAVRVPLNRRGLRMLRHARNHHLKVWLFGGGAKNRSIELRLAHRRAEAKRASAQKHH